MFIEYAMHKLHYNLTMCNDHRLRILSKYNPKHDDIDDLAQINVN